MVVTTSFLYVSELSDKSSEMSVVGFFKKNTILPHNKYPINLVGQAWGTFGPTGVTGVQLPSLMAILSGADGSYSPKAFGGTQVPHPCGR